jgi:hypothetical protein
MVRFFQYATNEKRIDRGLHDIWTYQGARYRWIAW